MLSMPEMGRASDEEIAYLPETELVNAAKQFRWIVETAMSSAQKRTLASQPMPTRTPPPVRTPFDWEPPATAPAGPVADDEPRSKAAVFFMEKWCKSKNVLFPVQLCCGRSAG